MKVLNGHLTSVIKKLENIVYFLFSEFNNLFFFLPGGRPADKHRSLRLIVQPPYVGIIVEVHLGLLFKRMIHCMVSSHRFSHSIQF